MDDAADEVGGKLLLDFKDTGGDRIQVFLEWHTVKKRKVNIFEKLEKKNENVYEEILFVPWMENVFTHLQIEKPKKNKEKEGSVYISNYMQ